MNSIRIRLATQADLDSIYRIEDDSFPDPYPNHLLDRLLLDWPGTFFVAETQSGKIVGYCVSSKDRKVAHMISIGVLQEYRRQGIGTRLIRASLLNHGSRIDEMRLEVKQGNADAIRLYEQLGFRQLGLIKKYYSDGSAAVKMRLAVRNPDGSDPEFGGRWSS